MISIAALQPADQPTWTDLFRGYNDFYERTWPATRYEQAWQEFRQGNRIHALGARLDGRLVGIAHFLVHANTTGPDLCYLQDLFTATEARGQGAARALIGAIEGWAREQGCGQLYWHTRADNHQARLLYDQVAQNRGFIKYSVPLQTD